MKIAVKELKPNPFRTKDFPLDMGKVKQLEANIHSTGFWDNVLARAFDGGYELAYGHHRLQALKNLGIKEIDIPIKDLDDATMLKIMAQENMEEWAPSHIVSMETVKAVYNFMKKNQLLNDEGSLMVDTVSEFMGWPMNRVKESLANLRATGEIQVDGKGKAKEAPKIKREIFEKLPKQEHAHAFREAVRLTGASPRAQAKAVKELKLKPADKSRAIAEIRKAQKEIGEYKEPKKSEIELRTEAMNYDSILNQIINLLPQNPPRELNEKEFQVLKTKVQIIIKRLRSFKDE